jgi:hypothetical protein
VGGKRGSEPSGAGSVGLISKSRNRISPAPSHYRQSARGGLQIQREFCLRGAVVPATSAFPETRRWMCSTRPRLPSDSPSTCFNPSDGTDNRPAGICRSVITPTANIPQASEGTCVENPAIEDGSCVHETGLPLDRIAATLDGHNSTMVKRIPAAVLADCLFGAWHGWAVPNFVPRPGCLRLDILYQRSVAFQIPAAKAQILAAGTGGRPSAVRSCREPVGGDLEYTVAPRRFESGLSTSLT